MAQKDSGDERPSLEMPSLGFGRKRKRATPEPAAEEPTQEVPPSPAPAREPEPDPVPQAISESAPTQRLDPVPPAPAAPPL